MNNLQPLLAFAETAKRGGFAAAARELGMAPSTLAKAVARLEAQLGLRLFHRTTRQVSLTGDGERLFQRCQRVLAELDELQSEASGARGTASGVLRIEMPITYGRECMLPLLARLREQHPAMSFDVRLSDAYADLVKDGIDVAIRVGALPDSTLVARRFDSQQLALVGAPAYLQAHGTPRRPADLQAHQLVAFRMPSRGRDRPLQFRVRGRELVLQPSGGHRFNDGDAMVRAAALGLGLAQVPSYMAERELASGALVELLHAYRPAPMDISAVTPGQRLLPSRVRVLLDALAEFGRARAGAAVA
jgi:DNA-binding transcriptional LysR family regulator